MSFSVLVSSEYTLRSGIAGSYRGFIPRFLRNLHSGPSSIVAVSACILTSVTKVFLFSNHLQHLLFVDFSQSVLNEKNPEKVLCGDGLFLLFFLVSKNFV